MLRLGCTILLGATCAVAARARRSERYFCPELSAAEELFKHWQVQLGGLPGTYCGDGRYPRAELHCGFRCNVQRVLPAPAGTAAQLPRSAAFGSETFVGFDSAAQMNDERKSAPRPARPRPQRFSVLVNMEGLLQSQDWEAHGQCDQMA